MLCLVCRGVVMVVVSILHPGGEDLPFRGCRYVLITGKHVSDDRRDDEVHVILFDAADVG